MYLQTKLHMISPNGSAVIAIKPKPKHRFQADAILLLYILQKISSTKLAYF
jgi:hypothetical protein